MTNNNHSHFHSNIGQMADKLHRQEHDTGQGHVYPSFSHLPHYGANLWAIIGVDNTLK